mmetsp:Transcript_2197/g.3236  ORF Transcript_2197/g.3236 Transcript_2197/m.3236 type:complete len:205 (-) Transcript_2197:52-666(-)
MKFGYLLTLMPFVATKANGQYEESFNLNDKDVMARWKQRIVTNNPQYQLSDIESSYGDQMGYTFRMLQNLENIQIRLSQGTGDESTSGGIQNVTIDGIDDTMGFYEAIRSDASIILVRTIPSIHLYTSFKTGDHIEQAVLKYLSCEENNGARTSTMDCNKVCKCGPDLTCSTDTVFDILNYTLDKLLEEDDTNKFKHILIGECE